MKKAKQILAIVLIAMLALSILTGCGEKQDAQNGAQTGAQSQTSKPAEKVKLRFSWWGGDARHTATLDAVNKYMELNPNVEIVTEYGGFDGYKDKIATQLSGGTAPDIMQIDAPWLYDFCEQGDMFADLGALSALDTSGFSKDFLDDFCMVDGKLVGVPTGINAFAMMMNTELLDEAGIDYSSSWSWEDVVANGVKLNTAKPESYLLNADSRIIVINIFKPYLTQLTGNILVKDDKTLGFTEEQFAQALAYIDELYQKKVFEPAAQSSLFSGDTNNNPKWINLEIAGRLDWSSQINNVPYKDSAKILSYPVAAGVKDSGILVRPAQLFVVSNQSKNAEEASKFLNFLYNDETGISLLKDVRSVPPTEKGREVCTNEGTLNPLLAQAIDIALENAGNKENLYCNDSEIEAILVDAMDKVAFSESSIENIAKVTIAQMQDILDTVY